MCPHTFTRDGILVARALVQDGNGFFKPVTEFEKDKVYVVEFWATWCGPCIAELPNVLKAYETYHDK